MKREEILTAKMSALGIELNETQIRQFLLYYDLLMEWNSVMNLTAITEYEEVVLKHFVDSLALISGKSSAAYLQEAVRNKYRVLDLGTGAGFPGIPLKIVYPQLQMVLIDSLNKRVKFLNEVIDQLHLVEIVALHGRAEDFARRPEHREKYDLCVSRAVANLATLSEYCIPYVAPGKYFIPYKSGKIKEELSEALYAIDKLGGTVETVEEFELSDSDMQRSFVLIRKQKKTAIIYPRTAGKPSKEPLKG